VLVERGGSQPAAAPVRHVDVARLLLLVHQLSWGGNCDTLPDEVREGYDGPVLNGRDLQRVPLPLRRQGGSVILRP